MKNSYLIIALTLLPFIGQKAYGDNITQTFHFSRSELLLDTIKGEDGVLYDRLSYGDLQNQGEEGSPSLPVKYISIPVPLSAENLSLKVERANVSFIYLQNKIYPNQKDTPTVIGHYDWSFVPCEKNIYGSKLPYPDCIAQIISIPSIRSDRVANIAIYPAQYFPTNDRIEFAEQVTISIDYQIPAFEKQGDNSIDNRDFDIGLPFYEYCIITSQSLKNSFVRLIAWQREKGLNAGVVCKEDILNNIHIVGDTVSSLFDDAGKIRQYLQYAYDSGITKYVLFGGNSQVLPIRYGTGSNNKWDETNKVGSYKIPTDFYFSELNSSWNVDGDQYLGEPSDNLNYGGQLYVGRLLCTTATDVKNYTDKLLRYELYPGNGDFSYLQRAFFQQADELQIGQQADYIAANLGGNFTIKRIIEEEPGPHEANTLSPTGKQVIDSMNVHYGYVSWFGHGDPFAVLTKSNSVPTTSGGMNHFYYPHGIMSLEACVPHFHVETGNGLDCLDNKDYPMLVYSIACTITPFDLYDNYIDCPNIGQSFTLGKDYGGPALIGNTRYGWVSFSYRLQKTFNDYVIDRPIGEAHVLARADYCNSSSYKHFLAHTSNVLGCPLIRLWTDEPKLFSASLYYTSNSCVLTANNSITDSEIGIRDITLEEETTSTISFDPSIGPKILTNVENCLLTITGKNCLPQIMPLVIQNDTLQGNHHLIVKNVLCGMDVRSGIQGSVIFDEDSDYTFETKGSFILSKGVNVKRGAILKVKPSEINY